MAVCTRQLCVSFALSEAAPEPVVGVWGVGGGWVWGIWGDGDVGCVRVLGCCKGRGVQALLAARSITG